MSPKFFYSLWVLFFVSAAVLWLADVFTLLTLVVFGFIAFGLVFTGMMCVLPSAVSHPPAKRKRVKRLVQPTADLSLRPARVSASRGHFPVGAKVH
jgi:hypothetical protein